MANIAFVIIFIVIIISQVTGVGIDNYGIKKTLPKLVIAAILVNLSFIICVLLVDTSNIIGHGIRQLFDSISPTVSTVMIDGSNENLITQSHLNTAAGTMGIMAIVILVGIVAIFVEGAFNDPATLLPLLLALLGALIGVIFLFVTLAVRQAGIVCLTVISPIAFVLYILPNTKKYFDKLKDVFWKLLLVFPIAGLLIGGGDFASRLLLTGGSMNFLQLLVAMAAGIGPIFFIPSVLTSALNALGGLGSRLQGLGNSLKRGAQNVAGNNRFTQEAKQLSAERAQRFQMARNSGVKYNRLTGRAIKENGELVSRGGLRQRIANSRFGEAIGAANRMGKAREQYGASTTDEEKNVNTARDMRLTHAQVNTARDAEARRLGTADEGVAVGRRENYAAMQSEKNHDTNAMNRFGYTPKSQDVADAERQNANNAAAARNNRPDAVKALHIYEAEQELRNRQTRALNDEGLEIADQHVLNAEQANRNTEVRSRNVEGVARVSQTVANAEQFNRNVQVEAKNNEGIVRIDQDVANAELANINVRAQAKNNEGVARIDQAVADVELANQNVQVNAKNTEGVARVSQAVANAELANANVRVEAKNTEGVARISDAVAQAEQTNQNVQVNAKNREGVAIVSQNVADAELANQNVRVNAKNNEGVAVVGQNVADMEQRNAVTTQDAKNAVGVAEIQSDNAIQRARNERIKAEAAEDTGVAAVNYNNELQRDINTRVQTEANEAQAVPVLDPTVATQRARAGVFQTEYKNTADQVKNQSTPEKQAALTNIVSGTGGIAEAAAASATADSLIAKGDYKELNASLETFNPSVAQTMNPDLNQELSNSLSSSGDFFYKGLAEQVRANENINMEGYVTSGAFGEYNERKGKDDTILGMNKDNIRLIAGLGRHGSASFTAKQKKVAAVNIGKFDVTTQRSVVDLVKNSTEAEKTAMVNDMKVSELPGLTPEMARAIGVDKLRGLWTKINGPGNETLRSNVSNELAAVFAPPTP